MQKSSTRRARLIPYSSAIYLYSDRRRRERERKKASGEVLTENVRSVDENVARRKIENQVLAT